MSFGLLISLLLLLLLTLALALLVMLPKSTMRYGVGDRLRVGVGARKRGLPVLDALKPD